MTAARERGPWLVALAFVPVYLLTLHHAHGWDSIAYAARSVHDPLLSERFLSTRLFHPHHLLYVPLAMLAQLVAGLLAGHAIGSGEAAFTAPMVLNALLGALSAGLAGVLAARLGASPFRATGAAIAVGLSNALWRYSTEVEVMVPALCCLLVAACLLAGPRTHARLVLAGLALAAAVLLHQIAVLFAGAATLVVLAEARGRAALLAAAWIVPVATIYLAVGWLATGAHTPAALVDWMLAARDRSTFGAHGPIGALREAMRAGAESLVSLRPLVHGAGDPLLALATAAVALWVLAVGLVTAPSLVRGLAAGGARAAGLRMVGLGLVLMVGFIAWFQPWNDDYWVYVPPLAIALVAACAPAGRAAGRGAFAAGLALTGAVNLVAAELPVLDARRASYADVLAFVADADMHPGDVLFSGGVETPIGDGIVALPFFAGVRVVPAYSPRDLSDQAHFGREALAAIEEANAKGHSLYVTSEGSNALSSVNLHVRYRDPPYFTLLRGETVWRVSAGGAAGSAAAP